MYLQEMWKDVYNSDEKHYSMWAYQNVKCQVQFLSDLQNNIKSVALIVDIIV